LRRRKSTLTSNIYYPISRRETFFLLHLGV
jgi:hypothetical protein